MIASITPRLLSKTDDGTLPAYSTLGDVTYTTVGKEVTLIFGGTSTPSDVLAALLMGGMLYSSANIQVKNIVKVDQSGKKLYLNEAFTADVSVAESLKHIDTFPYKSITMFFQNQDGILDGIPFAKNIPLSFDFNSATIRGIAYKNSTNSSTLIAAYSL